MKRNKLKTLLAASYFISLASLLLNTTQAFASCWLWDPSNPFGGGNAMCSVSASLYPTTGSYKGVNYGLLVSNNDKDPDMGTFYAPLIDTTPRRKRFYSPFTALNLDSRTKTYKYYTTRVSQWSNGEWHTYGHPFCFSINKAPFRADETQNYNGKYRINDYNGMKYLDPNLKFDPKPQTFLYYDAFTKKYVQTKIDVVLSSVAIPSFSCTTDVGNTDPKNTENTSRWQIWQPEGATAGVLYDSYYFFLYDAPNYSCAGEPIQPRKCNAKSGNDATNCLF